MADESDPPRKCYGLKPTEFERVNAPPGPPPADPSAPANPASPPPAATGRIDVKELFLQAQVKGPTLSSEAARQVESNDVLEILRANHARADAAGLNELAYKPQRRSKRKRDYWLLATGVAVVLVPIVVVTGTGVIGGNRGAAIPFVCSLAALIMIQIILWWIMWHVVDDYFE